MYFSNSPRWYLPAANFVRDFSANGVSVRGIFYDENPWIKNYGKAGNKYNQQWFQTHVSLTLLLLLLYLVMIKGLRRDRF